MTVAIPMPPRPKGGSATEQRLETFARAEKNTEAVVRHPHTSPALFEAYPNPTPPREHQLQCILRDQGYPGFPYDAQRARVWGTHA